MTAEMYEMMWTGVYLGMQFLFVTFLWCLIAGIVNKGVGG